jgi:membrane protein YdbS with pleckstrin-like domain
MIRLLRNVRLIGPEDPNNRGVTFQQATPLILVVIGVIVAIVGLVVGQSTGVWTVVVGVALLLLGLIVGMSAKR